MPRANKFAKRLRQEGALKRLEAQYETFKSAVDAEGNPLNKEPWVTTRNGGKRKVYHPGRTHDEECARLKKEIEHLKECMLHS